MRFLVAKSFSYPGVLTEWACSQSDKSSPSIPQDWMLKPVDSAGDLLYGMMIFSAMRFCPHHLPSIISLFYNNQKSNNNHVIHDIFVYLGNQKISDFLIKEFENKNEKLIDSFVDMLNVSESNNSYFQSQLMMLFFNYFVSSNNYLMISKIINAKNSNKNNFIIPLMSHILSNISFDSKNNDISLCIDNIVDNFDFHEVLQKTFPSWFDRVKIEIKVIKDDKLKALNYLFSFYPFERLTSKDKEAINLFFKDPYDYNDINNNLPHIRSFMQKSNLQEHVESRSSSKNKKERLI